MFGIADIEKHLRNRFKNTPIRVSVEYSSIPNDMLKVEFWFPIYSIKNRWWERCGATFSMSEESRCVENVEILIKSLLSKYEQAMAEVNE